MMRTIRSRPRMMYSQLGPVYRLTMWLDTPHDVKLKFNGLYILCPPHANRHVLYECEGYGKARAEMRGLVSLLESGLFDFPPSLN